MLQNANTRCNGLLPLWGPQVAEANFASCLAKHNTYLLEATRQLKHVRFALVGDGPQRADLERLFPADRTVFTGYLRGAPLAEAFASSDVFAFPSDTDTFAQTVLQALASGVPAVVAQGTAPAQFVPHGGAGLHVEARSPLAMAEAIRAIVDDPTLHARFVAGTGAAIAGRTWSALVDQMEALLVEAVAPRAPIPANP